MRIFWGLIIVVLLFACEGKHPEMQGKKLVLCDSQTMKKSHANCETIFIEPTDSQYALVFFPFLSNSIPQNHPYKSLHVGQSLSEFYSKYLCKLFQVTPVKNIPCFHLTDTDGRFHLYFVFDQNKLSRIDFVQGQ